MRTRLALLPALLLLGACAAETSSSPPTTAPTTTRPDPTTVATTGCDALGDRTDVAYVDDGDPLQRLDVYRPARLGCDPVPVVVWVHGGGWRIGDKTNGMADKVALWTDAGWAVVSVNYRLTDPQVPEAERVVAPAHNEDVAQAIGWLVDHADEVGIDPDRIALLGHSAGAGIVAALATDAVYLEAVGVQPADLACVGPLDTEAFSVEEAVGTGPQLAQVYVDAFGSDPARWAELSPMTHVGDAPLPSLLLVSRGTVQRQALTARFAAAVEAAGGTATVVDLPGFSHEDVNKEIGAPDDTVFTPRLQDYLTDCLSG